MIIIILAILVILALLLFLLLHKKIYIHFDLTYGEEEQEFVIAVYFFQLRIFHRRIDLTEEEMELSELGDYLPENKSFDLFSFDLRRIHAKVRRWHDVLTYILNMVTFNKMEWVTRGGTGDPVSTGIASGGVWTVKGWIIAYLLEHSHFQVKPVVMVTPFFQEKSFQTECHCMISLRLGKAMHVYKKVMRTYSNK